MANKILQTDSEKNGAGMAHAVDPDGNLVFVYPDHELKPGFRWADEDDVKIAHGVASIIAKEPDAPIDQVRDHVESVVQHAKEPASLPSSEPEPAPVA